ncbi:helix-turn-helix domain-containing protein, partial [Frankia sp. Cj3]|uniref:helix-turn-helix domain-containing protein n=1 Tax=Frankia sp. Cj3 TaxID=2880976 RepID=UPI001EF4FA1A
MPASTDTGEGEIVRAYRVTLDPTSDQESMLTQHAGAARWAFNHALAAKVAAHEAWKKAVADLVATGTSMEVARRQIKVPVPTKPVVQKALNAVKGDDRHGVDGVCPWWHTVSTYAFQSAFLDADMAWKAWLDSLAGRRKGRRVG